MISRIEVGSLRRMPIGAVAAVADAFGGSVDLTLRWEGAQLDHLTDAAHAWLTEATASFLEASGWTVRTEVSFNHFGDRGRVDVLAWHPSVRALAVVEVKSAIGDVQEALGRLDTKVRLGRVLAREAGWSEPAAVVRALVIGDSRRDRRVVSEHDLMFAAFALRGRPARAWARHPRLPAPEGLLWFTNVPDAHGMGATRHRRVRTARSGG
jgi:hypothetical protein